MKKYILIILIFGFSLIYSYTVKGVETEQIDTPDQEEVIFDYECQRKILLSKEGIDPITGDPFCNLYCKRGLIYDLADGSRNSSFCKYGTTGEKKPDSISSIEFFIPPEDAGLIYLRAGLYAVFGIAGLLVILYGLYGWYVRSMSGGEPDKVKQSMSIYKNAILGIIIIFSSILVIQLVYVFLGITEGPFDFNFIPKIGTSVDVKETDVGRKCYSNQQDSNTTYICDPTTKVWKKK